MLIHSFIVFSNVKIAKKLGTEINCEKYQSLVFRVWKAKKRYNKTFLILNR